MTPDQQAIMDRITRERSRHTHRDHAYANMQLVRAGRLHDVAPGMFPSEFPNAMIANMIDTAARDTSEPMASMPLVTVHPDAPSERARTKADTLTRLCNWYLQQSKLPMKQFYFADSYVTYGAAIYIADPDAQTHSPMIRVEKPIGCYWGRDVFDRLQWFAQDLLLTMDTFRDLYPDFAHVDQKQQGLFGQQKGTANMMRLIHYRDAGRIMLYLPEHNNLVIRDMAAPCMTVVIAERPGDSTRGQFDDVIWVQLLRARFATLGLDAAEQAIGAPIAVPSDVLEFVTGPDQLIRTSNPQMVRRVDLSVPPDVYRQGQALASEFRDGARYPQARSGNMSQSVVTGAGVDSLMAGFDSQITTAHVVFTQAIKDLLKVCLELDEKVYGHMDREIQGMDDGSVYREMIHVKKDIDGAREVAVTYGMMSGLNPNQALVFGLQARGDQLISRKFLRSQMPWEMQLAQEESQIDNEQIRDAIKSAIAALAQTIPSMAAQGGDPMPIMVHLAKIIALHQKGATLEDAIVQAFTPPAQPAAAPAPQLPGQPPGMPGAPPGMGGGGDPSMGGPPPDQAQQGAINPMGAATGGSMGPDMQTLLAGLTNGGQTNLGATIKRRIPIGA